MCRYVEKSNMEEAINLSEAEHECNSCAFGRPIYDNFEDIIEYECPYDYEVNGNECNSIYMEGDGV